jgi:hypothetical protein
MGEGRGAYRAFVGKPEGKRPHERPRHRWKDNIKIDLTDVVWGHELDRSGSEQVKVACSCKCGNEPSDSIKCGEFIEYLRTC